MESKKCAGNGGVVWLSFVLLALFSIACSGTDNSSDGITKEDAKKMGKADWTEDYCLENEWYWDGVCDPFCQKMDPDCKVNECIESCGVGCPAPEHWICGDDGQLYCNNCYMACYGASPANDPSTCEQGPSPEKCLEACGMGCPAPEYWICGEDGQLYCNECYMACYGVSPTILQPASRAVIPRNAWRHVGRVARLLHTGSVAMTDNTTAMSVTWLATASLKRKIQLCVTRRFTTASQTMTAKRAWCAPTAYALNCFPD
jgi:hypothetical protein